jgi:hypothetical protein
VNLVPHGTSLTKESSARAARAESACAHRITPGDTPVKRNSKGKAREKSIQVWTYDQAQAAIPYITSVVRSLREHAVQALALQRKAQRLAAKPGRPGRDDMIARQEAERQAARAETELQEAADELHTLDVFSLDPIAGLALVPFVHDEQLAWYIFDLFDAQPFRFWRFQTDPDDTRRPVTPLQKGLTGSPAV